MKGSGPRKPSSYDQALVSNDVAVLDELFWNSPHTIRYGTGENLYGYAEIQAFRNARSAKGLERQSQTWARTPDGWRVVSAHVSLMD
ncbi:MAG: DUF3225 domain-containing protein [Alphaproteobacteria bacterium]|nr:DUF3225 domain-containing protein [Alphaproteobacteria bacterium]